ncbi:hypothetical protein [Paracoccus siganidrum]|uniref:Uncharacterized protein n=1 Tax=Paracoccus siganidrum TaxID=1276757 RepID=A0A419A8C5_9RHOB|nr:hypothetical protein [Paracoccus siganidrum]RJL18241.1 hypothetical protein D3P05_07825 [Paracoccus siganidrum]RMC33418.1 hypothetical protein C9E82_13285 [Paracoccus siganidrum]
MKFSVYDRVLIHGLGLMSRPPLLADPANHKMQVRILAAAAERATAEAEIMRPLIAEADRIASNLGPHGAIAHHVAAAMNRFDESMMAAFWDKARASLNG